MVAWWPMDEQNGATALVDIVNNVQAGTKQGPVGSPQSPQAVAGIVNGAIHFPQAGAWARVTSLGPLQNIGSGDFTIDAWIKFPPLPASTGWPWNVASIVSRLDVPNKKGYAFYVRSPNQTNNERLAFLWGDGNNIFPEVQSTMPITPNTWHHVAVTFKRLTPSGVEVRLYVDGNQVGFQTANPSGGVGSLVNFLFLEIGGVPGSSDQPITIDELEFFNRALDPAEIQAIYNAGPVGKCK
jgi:hypothetical protein